MEEKIVYFDNPGQENTQKVAELALQRAANRRINKIVLASTYGVTAESFLEKIIGTGIQLIVIPWQYGFKEEGNPFPLEIVQKLKEEKHIIHFSTMLFHTNKLYGNDAPQALADVLRIFGKGIKVVVEIIMMACDGGCIQAGEKVVAVSGTHRGADTAVVATAANSNSINQLKINEIICKPL